MKSDTDVANSQREIDLKSVLATGEVQVEEMGAARHGWAETFDFV